MITEAYKELLEVVKKHGLNNSEVMALAQELYNEALIGTIVEALKQGSKE